MKRDQVEMFATLDGLVSLDHPYRKFEPVIDFGASPSPCYKWASKLGRVVDCETNFVYNLVLNSNYHVISDGVICVTLGHGITEGVLAQNGFMGRYVVPHNFFGNRELILHQLMYIIDQNKNRAASLMQLLDTEDGQAYLQRENLMRFINNDNLPDNCIFIDPYKVRRDENGYVISWV